jgi:molecular chaperone IbpA|tara:strand:+ start:5014 stop:5454 length:441 start_codon:yes stop_codon:yes gene_type:complete
MNAYISSNDPFFSKFSTWAIGHDRLFRDMINMVEKTPNRTASSYPPHNLIKNGNGKYVVELAAAGFSKEELEIKTEDGTLTISGRKKEEEDDEKFAQKGIAKRPFSKSFHLASDVVVDDVSFRDGMITIDLQQVIPEDKKEKIYNL